MSKLYVVPTPIGNLKDITFRSIEILKSVGEVLAEDTRNSRKLFQHYKIDTPLHSYHKFNEQKSKERIAEKIIAGTEIALISDAGTPGISDPGQILIEHCIKNNITVECLPGATAFIPALVNSGFSTESFVFEGFLPHKKGRQKKLKSLAEESRTIVLYESPYRVTKLINEIDEYFGSDQMISISREISKIYEETINGTPKELIEHYNEKNPKGEFVVIIANKKK